MESLAGPFAIACVVLTLAGARKAMDPEPTRGALRAMGLPWRGPIVFVLAAAEVATGAWALIDAGAVSAAAVGAWYLVFSVFVAVALRRAVPLASCGCLGTPDTPPTVAHLGFDLAALAVTLAVAIDPYGALADVVGDQPLGGVPFVGFVALGVYASYLVLAVLPLTLVATRDARRRRLGVTTRVEIGAANP